MSKKALLMILDGWGVGSQGKDDVIYTTPTPYWNSLLANYPHSLLQASGENVGLPDGQMGNSEVGHLNIGAGRIVYQDLVKINRACADNSILNNKEIVAAYTYAKENGKNYADLNIIVAHLGGGVSVGIHSKGRVIDVNDALRGEGPFSPERSGGLPAAAVVDACFSGKYTEKQIRKMISGEGGIVSLLGTNSFMDVENRVNAGDPEAILVNEAFAYQLAKEIGAMATVVNGKVDAIIITGGIAYNKGLMELVKGKVEFIAPVSVYPGEDEMGALAGNGLAVLNGTEEVKVY